MSCPQSPAISIPDVLPSSPGGDSDSSEDSVVGRSTAPDRNLVLRDDPSDSNGSRDSDDLSDDSSDGHDSL